MEIYLNGIVVIERVIMFPDNHLKALTIGKIFLD
jgi:hypothetical protein